MPQPQAAHFPRRASQPKRGMLCQGLMGALQLGQWLAFVVTLRSASSS
jgi:hypothetical protein